MSFEREYDKAASIVISGTEDVVRAAALQLFGAIIKLTPVDTGRLRGNWQAEVNSPNTSVLNSTDKGGSTTQRIAKSKVGRFTLKDVIYFTNNLPYAEVIENGSGSRRPYGMLRNSIKTFKPALENLARTKNK